MARKPRLEWEGASYHVMARGNERARIFKNAEEHSLFVETLGQSLERFGVDLHAWCLMPNHFHLAATTPRGNLSRWMAWVQTTFAARYNRRNRRAGHLFQGRYRAEVVEADAYARQLVMYIHLNPVRRKKLEEIEFVGGIKELASFRWSSHPDYLNVRSKPLLPLALDWRHYWRQPMAEFAQAYRKSLLKELSLKPLCWKEGVERGLVAGKPDFVEEVLKRLQEQNNLDARVWRRPLEKDRARKRVEVRLKNEESRAVVAWVRTRLLGERGVDVGKEMGYRDGSGVTQAARRLEVQSKTNGALREKLESYRHLSNVKN